MDATPGDLFEVQANDSQMGTVKRIAATKGAQIIEKTAAPESRQLMTLKKVETGDLL